MSRISALRAASIPWQIGPLLALAGLVVSMTGCRRDKPAPSLPPEQAPYERGVKLLRSGDIPGAQAAFDTAIRLKPDFAPAYLAQAEIDVRAGNIPQAIARLETLRRASPQTPHVACHLAELHAASGRFVESVTSAQEALRQEPDCPRAQTQYGLQMAAAGKMKEAISALQSAHRSAPQNERISLILAQMLARSGKPQNSWKLVDALPSAPNESAQALYLRGWLLAEYGREGKRSDKEALEMLDRALALAPDDGAANLEKGRILLRSGDARPALPYLQKARSESPPSVDLLTALADAKAKLKSPDAPRLKSEAVSFAKYADDLYAARQRYLADPNSRDNLIKLARLEAAIGNVQDAQQLLMQVLKRYPNDTEALELMTPREAATPHAAKAGPQH